MVKVLNHCATQEVCFDGFSSLFTDALLWEGDVEQFLDKLPEKPIFDLVVTSPPYNIGKSYENRNSLEKYLKWQERVIRKIFSRLKTSGSICWQVGNYISNGQILPLDIEMAPIFKSLEMQLRNRIVWHFGHGLHNRRRFSGRYEVVMWYTKGDDYTFNLDEVRIPPKYPEKRHFKGPKAGELSCNPKGKNPEDVWMEDGYGEYSGDYWDIPNVKNNHVEKTAHPCQFPVGLIDRLVRALTHPGDLVFDPFCGSGSAGVAALNRKRRFVGCELFNEYIEISLKRLERTLLGEERFRSPEKPIYKREYYEGRKLLKDTNEER